MLHSRFTKNGSINTLRRHRRNLGFTIVEIIVVLIVISILALATVYAYGFMTKDAVAISIQNDLNNAYQTLKSFQALNGNYPTTISCTIPDSTTNKCIRASNGGTYWYTYNNTPGQKAFGLTETIGDVSYRTNSQSKPTACPVGFIIVPGDSLYGTSDFCVMKYEPKMDDNGDGLGDTTHVSATGYTWPYDSYKIGSGRTIVSTAQGYPIGGIKDADLATASASVCTGCHLITEAEWLTIAKNVASVPSNWSGGAVGSGYVYIGHADADPSRTLIASTDDSDGYYGTNDSAGDMVMTGGVYGDSQRRTLTLTNGETIWDLPGNNAERTSGTIAGGQQPGVASTGYVEREWTDATINWNGLPAQARPVNNGLTGSGTWNCMNGMGGINSNYDETVAHPYWRSGNYSNSCMDGIYSLDLQAAMTWYGDAWGFRVTK